MENNRVRRTKIIDYVRINLCSFKYLLNCNISHIAVQNIPHNDHVHTIPCTQVRPIMWMVPLRNSNTPNYELPNIQLTWRKRHTCRVIYMKKTIFTWPLWLLRVVLFSPCLIRQSGDPACYGYLQLPRMTLVSVMQQPGVWKMCSLYLLWYFKSATQVFVLHKTDQWLLLQLYILYFFHGHLNVVPVNYIVGSVGRMFV